MFEDKEYFIPNDNGLILVEGEDRFSFIQGIISNDIEILKKKPSIYSSLLTAQGKFKFDFFITNQNCRFLIECNKQNHKEFLQTLSMYKLRSKVEIKIDQKLKIVLSKNKINNDDLEIADEIISFSDPRFDSFFSRSYLNENQIKKIESSWFRLNDKNYENLRLNYSIPNFFIDAKKEKSLLLEMRFDDLNGISWTKGCYMGQEITARMKHRNIVKKKIFKVIINYNNDLSKELISENEVIGNLLSHNESVGLALVKTKFFEENKNKNIVCGDSLIELKKPWWAKT